MRLQAASRLLRAPSTSEFPCRAGHETQRRVALVNVLDRHCERRRRLRVACGKQFVLWMDGRGAQLQTGARAAREGQSMSSQFAARAIRLRELFADPLQIEVPPYQRSYVWTSAEAGRLLDDITSAMEVEGEGAEAADYFLGTMLFIDGDRAALLRDGWPLRGPGRAFEVVDGLQRLTTLTILFCVLRDLDADARAASHARLAVAIRAGAGSNAKPRLTLRGMDENFFQSYVRGPGACRIMPGDDRLSPAEERILEVRQHFLAALLDFDSAQRQRLAEFLLERCAVVLVATIGIDRA